MRLLASSKILLTASIDSSRTCNADLRVKLIPIRTWFCKGNHNKWADFISIDNHTFQSGLSKLLIRVGVTFPLISSRGRLSSPPPETQVMDSDVLTVFFGIAEAPWRHVQRLRVNNIEHTFWERNLIFGLLLPQKDFFHTPHQVHWAVQVWHQPENL
jgi:hypothetical protein